MLFVGLLLTPSDRKDGMKNIVLFDYQKSRAGGCPISTLYCPGSSLINTRPVGAWGAYFLTWHFPNYSNYFFVQVLAKVEITRNPPEAKH